MARIKTEAGTSKQQILFCTQPYMAVSIILSDSGVSAVNGKKIIKAGTPITGDLTNRQTPFTVAATGESADAVGVTVHDVDVTDGQENAALMLFGYVDISKVDSNVVSTYYDTQTKAKLNGKITFLK